MSNRNSTSPATAQSQNTVIPAKAGISDEKASFNAQRLLELYDRVADAPDAVERLRKFVLDLAVNGKLLVQQDEWEDSSLGEIGSWGSGGTPARTNPDYYGGDIPWLVIGDLNDGIVTTSQTKITEAGLKNSSAKLVKPGTVLIAMYGSIGKLGVAGMQCATNQAIAHCVPDQAKILTEFLVLILRSLREQLLSKGHGVAQKNISQKILKGHPILLPTKAEQHRIVSKVNDLMALLDRLESTRTRRETTRNRLTTASLTRLTAPETTEADFPTHARFALDNLDQLTSRPEQIKELRQTILNLAVRGKLVEQDPADEPASVLVERLRQAKERLFKKEGLRKREPVQKIGRNQLNFDFPETWALPCFDDLFVIVSGVTKGGKVPAKMAVELPYLRVANVQRGYLDLSEVKKIVVKSDNKERYHLRSGDILMTEGGDWDKLGRAAIWGNELADCIHQNHIFRVRPPSKEILPDWVIVYVNSELGRSFFEDASKQTTNLASINMTQLRSCPLPLPSLDEQHRIVKKIDALMALCDQLDASLTKADNTRVRLLESLLHKALLTMTQSSEAA